MISLATLFRAFGRSGCQHDMQRVCVWNLDFSDFGAASWDGAYTAFCTECRKFAAEISAGMNDRDGTPRYPDGRIFVHLIDGTENIDADHIDSWTPVAEFRHPR